MKKLLLVLLALAAPCALALPGPASASFDKGAMFTVAGYTGSSPLSGFPVLVRIQENSPAGFSYADLHSPTDGDDLAFVGMDGAGLPYEIDTWNTNGTSLIWVRLPSMSSGTQFVMCWGSDSSGRAVSAAKPWADYTGVWHMNEDTAGVTTIHDSTANALDGTTVTSSASKTDGKIGRARLITTNTSNTAGNPYDSGVTIDMTGDTAKLNAVNAIVPEFTASFWVRPQNNAQWWYFITRKASDAGPGWGLQQGASGDFTAFRAYGGTETDANCSTLSGVSGLSQQQWTKLDAVWMSDKTFMLYVNGAFAKQCTLVNQAANGNQNKLALGGAMGPTDKTKKNGRGVYGDMDEIRLRAGALSPDWIAADCATVTNSAFLTPGTAEEYEVNNGPRAGLRVSDVGYSDATVSVTVYSRGAGATSAEVTVEISAAEDFSSPVWTTTYAVNADNDVRTFNPTRLAAGTTFYARAIVANDLDAVLTTPTTTFATTVPGPVFSASVDTDHIAPVFSLSFASAGLGEAVTRIDVLVSTANDFSHVDLSRTYTVDLATMPTNVTDLVLAGLPASSPLYFRFTAVNSGGYNASVELSASLSIDAGDNVWSGLSENIDDPNAYVFAGGLPAPGKTLYFTTPAGLSPVINRDVAMPSLRFWTGKKDNYNNDSADTAYLNGYHSCGYDFSGSGVLTFTAEKPIMQGSYGTNVIRNPILFSRSNTETVTITSVGEDKAWLVLNGTLMLPYGVTNTTMKVTGRGNTVLGGASPDFMGQLSVEGGRLSFASPCAMTNVSKFYFSGDPTSISNAIGAPLVFPRVSSISMDSGWPGRKLHEYGAPFVFPQATFSWRIRDYDQSTFDADWVVSNVVVRNHGSNTGGEACGTKTGAGTFVVKGETSWYNPSAKSFIKIFSGCFWAQTDAGLPPSGEFYIPRDSAWQSTIGLSRDFYPRLDGSSTPRMFQESKWASWGFTGFGGERTVCWNADPTLNLTNTTGGTVSIPLGDAAHTNAIGKAYSNYYAYPAYLMFGNRSEYADGTILFLNPIRYELGGQEWDTKTFFESTNHVVAARLRGSLRLGSRNKTWTFTGRKFGGYLALEADNPDFNGNVSVTEKGNLLVNSNLVARSVAVQAGSGLGGTGSLSTADGTTVKSGGALFGGEWNKGGLLTLGGKVTFENGSALRAEVGPSTDRVGFVKLASGAMLSLGSPVYVEVDTDPRVSPVRGTAIKVLDWSEMSFEPGAAPTREDFVARPESNPDMRTIFLFVRDSCLYVSYISVRYPPATIMLLR
jgi:hypothetical protein